VRLRIEPFDRGRHDRTGFECGATSLDDYLARQATQDVRRNVASLFCLTVDDDPRVAGYYTLCANRLPLHDLPADLARGLPRYADVPAILLGRLAVHRDRQRAGLGDLLIADALGRSLAVEVAAWCVVVDALSDRAAQWYQRYGFRRLPDHPLRLVLPTTTIRKLTLRR
jgi:GNAT superfamily N-acetyltransferase